MQTDDILRTYPEYQEGRDDFVIKGYQPQKYPLIDSGGRFVKKAYRIGYFDAKRESENG